jgi:ribosomal protein L37AE/L43A
VAASKQAFSSCSGTAKPNAQFRISELCRDAASAKQSEAKIVAEKIRELGLRKTKGMKSLTAAVWRCSFLYKPVQASTRGGWYCMQCQKFYKQGAAQAEAHIVVLLLLKNSAKTVAEKIRELGLRKTKGMKSLTAAVWRCSFLYKPVQASTRGGWYCMQCQKFYKQGAAQAEAHIVVLLLLLHCLPALRVSFRGVCFRLCKTLLMSRARGWWVENENQFKISAPSAAQSNKKVPLRLLRGRRLNQGLVQAAAVTLDHAITQLKQAGCYLVRGQKCDADGKVIEEEIRHPLAAENRASMASVMSAGLAFRTSWS